MLIDILMNISAIVFATLFAFITLTNTIILISFFIKNKQEKYQPKISIIIPAYNEEKRIKNCITSIINTEYPRNKYEIILVDDGSTDNTIQTAKQTLPTLKIIKTKHQGKVNALNQGIKQAKYDYVLTIDADTTIDKNFITNIAKPFKTTNIGAVAGIIKAQNTTKLIQKFQNIEFYYANLQRIAFTKLFNQGIWLNGAATCYKKTAIQQAGGLKQDTETEDLDITLQLYKQGYRTITAPNATASTQMPTTIKELVKQRTRWCTGNLQSIQKHKQLFSIKESPSIIYTFINQKWWAFFSIAFFPLTIIQILYWLPQTGNTDIALYIFRWFSLAGPTYFLYKLPEWGFTIYNFSGVMSGITTTIFLIISIKYFKDSTIKNTIAIFFYFPYTILLNISNVFGIIKYKVYKPAFFIR